jgi:hypothetical protein
MNLSRMLALPVILAAGQAAAQTPTLSISDSVGPEGNSGLTSFVFTVTLSPASSSTVRVKWSTEPCTAEPKVPCGSGEEDYLPDDGVLVFLPGDLSKTITVKVIGDTEQEGQEAFFVALSAPENAVLATSPQGQGQGIILNDDGALPAPARVDYNADGRTDILWRHQISRRVVTWTMDGLNRVGGTFITLSGVPITLDANETVVGTADFDGDGDGDILLQNNATGVLDYLYLNGTEQVGSGSRDGLADLSWKIAGTADFNGDGHTDLLWRHEGNGHMQVWFMNDREFLGSSDLNPLYVPLITDATVPDLNWRVAGIGDFDGDGNPDILFRHEQSHRLVTWEMNGVNRVSGSFVTPDRPVEDALWDVAGVWDVDQNGIADIVFRHNLSGALVVWFMDADQDRVCGTYFNPPELTDLNWKMVGPR